jgi:hypothetical protein
MMGCFEMDENVCVSSKNYEEVKKAVERYEKNLALRDTIRTFVSRLKEQAWHNDDGGTIYIVDKQIKKEIQVDLKLCVELTNVLEKLLSELSKEV